MAQKDTLMVAGKARWLLDGGIDQLDDDERSLLLALASLEVDTGRTITDEERQALDQLIARSGADADNIAQAVKHMVEAETKKSSQKLDWSALKRRFRRE